MVMAVDMVRRNAERGLEKVELPLELGGDSEEVKRSAKRSDDEFASFKGSLLSVKWSKRKIKMQTDRDVASPLEEFRSQFRPRRHRRQGRDGRETLRVDKAEDRARDAVSDRVVVCAEDDLSVNSRLLMNSSALGVHGRCRNRAWPADDDAQAPAQRHLIVEHVHAAHAVS